MKPKIFKTVLLLALMLYASAGAFAQAAAKAKSSSKTGKASTPQKAMIIIADGDEAVNVKINLDGKHLAKISGDVAASINNSLKIADSELNTNLDRIGPMIAAAVNNINIEVATDCDVDVNTSQNDEDLVSQSKTYSKSYTAGDNNLAIDNRYGKVTVNTWNKNEFKVDVQIKCASSTVEKAKKLLDDVNIQDGQRGSTVFFKTDIGGSHNSWMNFSKVSGVRKMEINYIIYMPADNALAIENHYGGTELPDLKGHVAVNSSYGSFSAKSLANTNNAIVVKYGSAVIGELNSGNLDVSYGSLNVNQCGNVNANVSYSGVKIGNIKNGAAINARYGSGIVINNVDRNIKKLSVNSSYSNVKVGLPDTFNADFNVVVKYGSFNYNNNTIKLVNQFKNNNGNGWSPTQAYRGQLGTGNGAAIAINATYGSVKFE